MFTIAILLLWLLGWALFWRIPLPQVGASPERGYPSLSIIIPARNEEKNLPAMLNSIHGQGIAPVEILVVDDESSDSTAECARKSGATVIPSQPLPQGWRGKTWACYQGACLATGEVLLFLDADTWLEPEGLRKIFDTYLSFSGVLSVCPYHAVQRPYEQLSAFFNLMMTVGMGTFTCFGGALQTRRLFGQMLMLRRSTYFQVGGHETARGRILENFALAADFNRAGVPMKCLGGNGTLAFRMYPEGLEDLIEGWTKGFASGAGGTEPVLMVAIVAWISGLICACSHLVCGPSWESFLLYLLFALQLAVMLRRIGSFRWGVSLFYPVPLAFYFLVFTRSLLRSGKQVEWKGRQIHAD